MRAVSDKEMKCLSIQIQPDRCAGESPQDLVAKLQDACGELPCVSSINVSEVDGAINVNCNSSDPAILWAHLKRDIYECDSVLPKASIVVCEGEAGWDDYLLLHHFDEDEELDSV
jgi:hypothetical protein